MSLGDFAPGTVLYDSFVTIGGSTPVPTTLSGTPAISVYKDASTTESTAGVTLVADFDSRTGYNTVTIDTSADGTFYSAGSVFRIVVTAGTVAGNSIVGFVVNEFTLNKTSALRPATGGRTLVVDSSGLADSNMVKAGPTGSGTAQTARDIGGALPAAAPNANGGLPILSVSGTTLQYTITTLTNFPVNGDFNNPMKASIAAVMLATNVAGINGTIQTLDSLRTHGDATWATATGFSTLTDAQVWAYSTRILTAGTNIVLVKGTGVTGFNDIAATAIVSNGAITTLSGAVVSVTTTATATNLTNAPTAGDFTAAMKTSLNSATPSVPTAAAIAAATRDVNNASPAANSLGAAVNNASAPTVDQIDTKLSAVHGSGEWGSSSGSGAFLVTVTVTDGTNPIPNANVRLAQGITSVVATTDGSGAASFSLDAATYALTITESRFNFEPSSIVVTAAANFDEVMTPVVIPTPPSGSPMCNVFGFFQGVSSNIPSGKITFTLSHSPAKAGAIICPTTVEGYVANGQLQSANGANYVPLIRNDSITPDDTTYAISFPAIGLSVSGISLTTATKDLADEIS